MTKKPKKAKTPRVKGGGRVGRGSKDTVTGLYFEAVGPGGTMKAYSDTVIDSYDAWMVVGGGQKNNDIPPARGYTVDEFEFNKNFLVNTRVQTNIMTGEKMITRIALEGQLQFEKGRLKELAWTRKADSVVTISQAGVGLTSSYSLSGAILESATPYTFRPPYIYGGSNLGVGGGGENAKADYSFDGYINQFTYGGAEDKQALEKYAGGRFFHDGWWNNPFDSNLI
jgi:hypothetical protein